MTLDHTINLISHMWKKDWVQHVHPAVRVFNHAGLMEIMYTPTRIGELWESSARKGSGRGLYYKVERCYARVILAVSHHNLGCRLGGL